MAATRMAASERREQIVDATCRVIVAKGIHAFRLRHVAEEAGVSQPLVSAHFETRNELIGAAFAASDERALSEIARDGEGAPDGRARVLAYMLACMRTDPAVQESWDLWYQVWSLGAFAPELYEQVRERQATWIALIADHVREGQADGSISGAVDADRAGLLLVTLLDGIAPSLRFKLVDLDTARDIIRNAVEQTLERPPSLVPS